MSDFPVSKPSSVKVPVEFIHESIDQGAQDQIGKAGKVTWEDIDHWCYVTGKITKERLDLLDGEKDGLVDSRYLEQVAPTIVATWDEEEVYTNTSALIREVTQSKAFKDRLLTLFDPSRKGLEARYAYTPYAEYEYTLGGPNRVSDPEPLLPIHVKVLKADLARLSPEDKIELLLSLRHKGDKHLYGADGERIWREYLFWGELFPHLQGIYQEDSKPSEVVRRLLGQLKIKKKQWQKKGGTDPEARLEFLATWFYLDSFLDYEGLAKFPYPILKKIEKTLDGLYDPALFDSDWDGKVDGEDPFPSYSYYREDANHNKIPDELEKLGRDPAHLYSLAEGQMLQLGNRPFLNLVRLKDQVYLIVNITLVPEKFNEHNLMRPDPVVAHLREQWKEEIEQAYREMLPPALAPLQVRVNFFHPEGSRVKVYDKGIRENKFEWSTETDRDTLCHELGHHLGWADRYSRSNAQYEMGRYLTDPGLLRIWDRPHLMNENTYKLDPVDLAAVVDAVIRSDSPFEEPNLAVAELYLEHGEFAEAEAIYLKHYEKLHADIEEYFPEVRGQHPTLQIVALEALKGYLHARLHRYHATQDKALLPEIDAKLDWLEKVCETKQETSAEAAWYYQEAQRLRKYRSTGQDPYEKPDKTALHAPLPIKDKGTEENKGSSQKFALFNFMVSPVVAQRFISTGTGRMGYFNSRGDQVNPNDYRGKALQDLQQKEITQESRETGAGVQLQLSHRFFEGYLELLGQGGLLRFKNFANGESRTEINTMAGLNMHFSSWEAPDDFHPYLGWRLGGSYDVDQQTFALAFNPLIPTILGFRVPLGGHFLLDSSASFLADIRPGQNHHRLQGAIRLQAGLGILYQP